MTKRPPDAPAKARPVSPQRSATMRAVKGKDTKPELLVRRLVHGMGYRYRLHRKDLPGKPDLTFAGRRRVIFVHGCFWHGHDCARGARVQKNNRDYWLGKIGRNRGRDAEHQVRPCGNRDGGRWCCGNVNCATGTRLTARLSAFLEDARLPANA